MNQLEAEQLIEEAKKYIGKTVNIFRFDNNNNRKKILCRYDGEFIKLESRTDVEKTIVQVIATMHIVDTDKSIPDGIQFMIERYKEQEK